MKKIKKTLLAVTAFCSVACAAGAFAACADVPAEHNHVWDGGEVTTAATCETDGVKTFTCTQPECGEKKTEPVAAYGHDWGDWSVSVYPEADKKGEAVASCANDGCEEKHTAELPVASDITYTRTSDDATCTKSGSQHYTVMVEGKNVEFDLETKAKGHNWTSWSVQKPTDTDEGSATRTCAVEGCGGEESYVLPVTGSEEYTVSTNHASCTDDGHEVYSIGFKDGAGNDVEVNFTNTLPATGHLFSSSIITLNKQAGDKVGKVCEHCGRVEKEFYYLDNSAVGNDKIQFVGENDYFAKLTTNGYVWLKLDLSAAQYEIDFEHFASSSIALVLNVYLDDSATKIVSGSRVGAVQPAFADVATLENVGNDGKQTKKFTFDASAYGGHYLRIQLIQQSAPEFTMSIKASRNLKYGSNKVGITDSGVFEDAYTFVPEADGVFSMTVADGLMVLMNGEDFIIDGSWANFEAKAGEPITFTFSHGVKGAYSAVIGDKIVPPSLTVDGDPVEVKMISGTPVAVEIGADVAEGTYTIEITGSTFLMGRMTGTGYMYFMAGGNGSYDTLSSEGLLLSAYKGNGTEGGYSYSCSMGKWSVTLTLKAGDVVYFAPDSPSVPVGTAIASVNVTLKAA
ncbi:MAG: hypothetical protein K2L42_06210 [Clostridia bacterium]|nr:hypothetical protein [Clostridia bacterium]